tara:strand:- start:962 stop:1141 length:180 start_codon:yes stop_codon:yes gene_type:complete
MNKLNSLKDSFLENNDSNEVNKKDNEINKKIEKILCNHCGRTTGNGIRCKGMCVADNDY